MDEIIIESLHLKTRIGVNRWEQAIDQTLVIDIHLFHNFADIKDEIEHTIDYEALCQHIETLVTTNAFQLIETVANDIASAILDKFSAQQVKVVVNKPHALKQAKNVKAVVTRSKNS